MSRGLFAFPGTPAEWTALYPNLPTPVHGWVFDTELPIVDGFGAADIDQNAGSTILFRQAFKGRGGGRCVEQGTTGLAGLYSSANVSHDRSGDWAMLVSFWRGGEDDVSASNRHIAGSHTTGPGDSWMQLYEQAHSSSNVFLAGADDGVALEVGTLTFPNDAADPTYNTGWDFLMSRDGASLDFWCWNDNEPTKAYHEFEAVDLADDFTAAEPMSILGASGIGQALAGRQVRAVYLFEAALDRDDGDIYRGLTTESQSEV